MKLIRSLIIILILASAMPLSSMAEPVTIKILNNCQGQSFKEIGPYVAGSGKVFLVVGLEIELDGSSSDSFYIDSSFFQVDIDGNKYPYSLATFSLVEPLKPLETMTLGNGNKINGYTAFEVPEGFKDFHIEYIGDKVGMVGDIPKCNG